MPRCPLHDSIPNGVSHGWAEPDPLPELPLVLLDLNQLSLHIHCLLQSHGGTIPLARYFRFSFVNILFLYLISFTFFKKVSLDVTNQK